MPNDRFPVEPPSSLESSVINYVEQYWFTKLAIPSVESASEALGLSRAQVAAALSALTVIYELEDRGISLLSTTLLTEKQLAAANTIANVADRRSIPKKLNDLGISTPEYDGWRQNPVFIDYLTQRAENQLKTSTDVAHRALMERVAAGDPKALQMFYEITGRFSFTKADTGFDVGFVIIKVLEILSYELRDQPEVMASIGEKLQALAPNTQMRETKPTYKEVTL